MNTKSLLTLKLEARYQPGDYIHLNNGHRALVYGTPAIDNGTYTYQARDLTTLEMVSFTGKD